VPQYLRSFHSNPYFQATPQINPHQYSDVWPASTSQVYGELSQDDEDIPQRPVPPTLIFPPSNPRNSTETIIFPASQDKPSFSSKNDALSDEEENGKEKKNPRWDDAQIRHLLAIWQENYKNIGKKRNKAVWDEIAKELNIELLANGIKAIRTGQQCKSKIKNLTDEYKKVSDANSKSGNNRHQFVYYDAIDEVLGSRDSAKPTNISEVSSEPEDTADTAAATKTSSDDDRQPSPDTSTSSKANNTRGKTRAKKRKEENDGELTRYLEESEKREREFFLRLAEMEERQQERNIKMIAEIAKMLKN
jgi:hypothetical protein